MTTPDYFPSSEPFLKERLDLFLGQLAEDLARQPFNPAVRALLLAGGYGRGEGGIFRTARKASPQLYNDLEFYLILRNGTSLRAPTAWIQHQSHSGDEQLGIEVEFKILHENALRNAHPSMFFYDLVAAHRFVAGSPDFIATLPARLQDPTLIPPEEATRLLFNRGAGLFFSKVALQRSDERLTNGFIERNHAKVRLALADAVLALNGQYHYSCRERHLRLSSRLDQIPPDWDTLCEWHREGVEFKLTPRHTHPSRTELEQQQAEIVRLWLQTFLWLESIRLKTVFTSPEQYARTPALLFPKTNRFRNMALALRDQIRRGGALSGWTDYPRATLQRALVLFLSPSPQIAPARLLLQISQEASWAETETAFTRWWRFYN